ncbi:hypothetical protein [Aquisphaera insulae]|uniref:hypothetical protein n=1 Tax=Aquisphaera insulae TaxID=2712864 RepID=UPI0013ED10A9|nr:hypothetical protein [Aquisphaera insulae]
MIRLQESAPFALLTVLGFLAGVAAASAGDVTPIVEVEENVYTYTDARNGAGPMWCAGSTTLVRSGDRLFASGLETIPGAEPLNNCRWVLFTRDAGGWRRVRADDEGRTREPSPMAAFADGRVFLSVNPTLNQGSKSGAGPARPDVLQFQAGEPDGPPKSLAPAWKGSPAFTEHSYRSFVADGPGAELLLLQNIDYAHAEWTFRDHDGAWSASGQLRWPTMEGGKKPTPLRLCYPNVALRNRSAFFFGVGDIFEPNDAWRAYKRELTGREWDYVFCRLFYSWTPDIASAPFAGWVEIANRDATRGHVWPCDLWVAPGGDVHLLWTERAIDERLRAKFFPEAKQSESLNHGVVRDGKLILRQAVAEEPGEAAGVSGSGHRFHVTPDDRLFVVHRINAAGPDGRRTLENRIVEILPGGKLGRPAKIPLGRPFTNFFTATPRAGSPPSWTLDMLGERAGVPNAIGYARVRLGAPDGKAG